MKLKIELNQKSISHAIGELKRYRESLATKNEIFVRRLLDEGIRVAKENTGGYGRLISFSKDGHGGLKTVGYMVADSRPITAEWAVKDENGNEVKKTAEVSPLLMAEFGSGPMAEVLFDIAGVGQGTFPGQTHAFETSWWYKDWETKEWHQAFGIRPKHPMHKAEMAMIERVQEIAREVFNSGN